MPKRVEPDGVDGDPNHPTAIAIRRAAAELFMDRSPASVSLRQIAARAGVNYGLIHHYFRTKEKLIGEVFADFSKHGAERIREITDLREALRITLPDRAPDGWPWQTRAGILYTHMLAWTVLDGSASKEFQASATFQRIRALVKNERRALGRCDPVDESDERILTATVMAAVLGWQFFKPFVRAAGELDEVDDADASERMVDFLALMIRSDIDADPSSD